MPVAAICTAKPSARAYYVRQIPPRRFLRNFDGLANWTEEIEVAELETESSKGGAWRKLAGESSRARV